MTVRDPLPQAVAPRRIAFLLPSLAAGGVARSMLRIAGAFQDAGHAVELVLCKREGPAGSEVPAGLSVVTLRRESRLVARIRLLALDPRGVRVLARPALLAWRPALVQRYVGDLTRYLKRARPDVLIAAKTPTNLLALWARAASGVDTAVIVSERTQLSTTIARDPKWRWHYIAPLVGRLYATADAVTCVSDGVGDDLARTTGLPRARIRTIYNPVVTPELPLLAAEPAPHPWLAEENGPPVVVGAGRLLAQKNFDLLLRAFARLRARRPARLLIFGEGRDRPRLERLAQQLGMAGDVALPGHIANPYAAFSRASLFVLSSDWEGMSLVVAEALACGCPVVSTDCPSGPAEILEGGRYGRLVPVGDELALAQAMELALEAPIAAEALRRRGAEFSLARSAQSYFDLVDELMQARRPVETAQ
jgi:glycosyltransferase involved in cell wall biosynthesis